MEQQRDHVRAHSPESANEKIDRECLEAIATYAARSDAEISARLVELDKEWDIERTLEVNAASITLASVTMSVLTHKKRWLILSAAVPAFLIQHAVQGWCPPMEVLRRKGIRTRKEIDAERTALKALRGDFAHLPVADRAAPGSAEEAIEAVQRT